MKILGVHIGHDSSASLVIDGKIVADVAEERFNRIKHYAGLPRNAVNYCLNSQISGTLSEMLLVFLGDANEGVAQGTRHKAQ